MCICVYRCMHIHAYMETHWHVHTLRHTQKHIFFKDLKVINHLSNIFLAICKIFIYNCPLRRSLKRIFQKTNNTNLKFLFKCPQNVSSKLSKSFEFLVFLHLFSFMMNGWPGPANNIKTHPKQKQIQKQIITKIKNKIYHKTNSLNSNYKNITSF